MDDVHASRVSLHDRLGLSKAFSNIPIRVSITGTRGKSSQAYLIANALTSKKLWVVAKVTGDTPFFMDRDGVYNILRKKMRPVFLDETAILSSICQEASCYPDAIVLENQAIQPYTMFAFHELYSNPNYIIVTNVRRDHQEFLGATKEAIANAYGESFSRAKRIISGDLDESVNDILRDHAHRIGAQFHAVVVPHRFRGIPGAENVYSAQKLLELVSKDFPEHGDVRLSDEEIESQVSLIDSMVSLHPSTLGIDWYDGAKLNDVDSTGIVLKYLMRKHREKRFVILAYFRGDRPARTITFSQYFNELMDEDRISEVYVAGTGAKYVHDRAEKSHRARLTVVKDTESAASKLILRMTNSDDALVTVANAVSPFMRHVRGLLTLPTERHVIYQTARDHASVPQTAVSI